MNRILSLLFVALSVGLAQAQPLTTKPNVSTMTLSNCTAAQVILGGATSPVCSTAMTDGQLLVGQTGSAALPRTVSGNVSIDLNGVVTIAAGAVTYARIQDISATQRFLGRNTAGAGVTEEVTATQALDWIGSTRGSVLYRGAAGWSALTPGTSGYVLSSNGPGADPSYIAVGGTGTVTQVDGANGLDGSVTTTGNIRNIVPVFEGRITLQSGVPVMRSTQAAQTTIYYTGMKGCYVTGYDGTRDVVSAIPSCQVSTALQAASTGVINSGGVFDVWWSTANSNICVATNGSGGGWASDTAGSNTARGTGYSQLNLAARGYYTNANALATCYNGSTNYGSISANRASYLGTFYSTGAGQTSYTFGAAASGGTAALFGVWNYYNRVYTGTNVIDNGAGYAYSTTSATWRQARASAGNQIQMVIGVDEDDVSASYMQRMDTPAVSLGAGAINIGLDTCTVAPTWQRSFVVNAATTSTIASATVTTRIQPGIGIHQLCGMEWFFGAGGTTFNADLTGTLSALFRN